MPHPNKDGAALLIALGFLALLTITILAFAVQMRTERLAGRSYLTTAQNRQLLHTALSRALEDIDTELGGTTDYPEFFALGSLGNSGVYLDDSIDFATETAYLPGSNSPIHAEYLNERAGAEWQELVGSDNQPIGRVGYIILNTSGLLDANAVGGSIRGAGTSPSELELDPELLEELGTTANAFKLLGQEEETSTTNAGWAFTYNRNSVWHRFESLRDVRTLNMSGGGGVIAAQPESFSTFSLYPSNAHNMVELTTNMDRVAFTDILLDCNLTAEEADAVYEGYLDYVDADSIPNTLYGSSTEAVPMVNEIRIENFRFFQDPQDPTNVTYSISGELHVETWYPFSDTHASNTTLELVAAKPDDDLYNEIVEGNGNEGEADYITVTAVYGGGVGKTFILNLFSDEDDVTTNGNFQTIRYTFGFDRLVALNDPIPGDPGDAPQSIQLREESIEVLSNAPIDRVEHVFFELRSGENQTHSAIDPRINHDFSDPTQWSPGTASSPNAINQIAEWGEQFNLADKSKIRLYVRNGPMLNAAELGHLSIGIPWRTVRLYGGEGETLHPVLDHFHANEYRWTAATRPGLININSPHTNILATAFRDAPIQNTPAIPFAERVSSTLALQLGSNLATLTDSFTNQNYSIVGLAVSNNIPGWIDYTDAQKEAIVANTYRLFGWRDTHYTILLAAQTLAGDEVQSTQQAVVHIWRDPVTGKCACVFFGLSDTLRTTLVGDHLRWTEILQAFRP